MSIRLRLTLLYSGILAITLAVLGVAIYIAVSQVTLQVATNSLTTETKNLSDTLQPFSDPDRGGALTILPPSNQGASLSLVQARTLTGTVIYQSNDLKALHFTIPLDSAVRQPMQPGSSVCDTTAFKGERFLVCTVLLEAHLGPQRSPGYPGHGGTPLPTPNPRQSATAQPSANSGRSATPPPGGNPNQHGAPFGGPPTPFGVTQVARSLKDVDQTLNTLRQVLLLGGIVATVLACGAGWVLAGTALHPIRRITRSAQAIGEVQDFARRVSYTGPRDEIGRLAATLNGMLERLQEAYQTQRRFVADASHELRTPLTSIRGNLGLLQRKPPIAEVDRVAVLDDLVSESERLSRLVNELLTLARSDAGRGLRQDPVPLDPLVPDLVRRLGVAHPERLLRVGTPVAETVLGDPDALTQVLVILLDNALKFTPAGGTVSVEVRREDRMVAISVRDTGTGIAPEVLPKIFDRFFQGDAARTGTGTGLGLAIARTLVEGQHGTIDVQSEVGRGSVFTVRMQSAR